MCELTMDHVTVRSRQNAERSEWLAFLHRDVQRAETTALESHRHWMLAIHQLTVEEDAEIALLLMRGDYCEAGRKLGVAVRREVIEEASATEKDRISELYGIDLDEETP